MIDDSVLEKLILSHFQILHMRNVSLCLFSVLSINVSSSPHRVRPHAVAQDLASSTNSLIYLFLP